MFLRGQQPALWQKIIMHLGPGQLHVIGRSLSHLRPCQKIRWLGCMVCMSKHLAFLHFFMSKFNQHMYIIIIIIILSAPCATAH